MAEQWERIKAVFLRIVECHPSERARFLDSECQGNDELRREVEALFAAHEAAGTFLEAPAYLQGVDTAPAPVCHDDRIGPYQLLREIGRGGMGAVYLAARADDVYRKQVALKVVREGMTSAHMLERFRRERQLQANLDHPNIAKLLDGGTTPQGQPYFVMEFVDAQPIDRYCDDRRLGIDERLRLFRTVCAAVQYAHQNLIVHRDLKPENILVDAAGTPKLVDFGIAKLLTADSEPLTRISPDAPQRLLTYEYASPEQVRGDPITTATDVYSLGVVLYELLTGRRPYAATTRRPEDLERAICEMEPVRPSTRVMQEDEARAVGDRPATPTPDAVSRARGGRPDRLQRRLRGDLDTIVLKALRKEPQRRYASVEQLSEDLRRHLEGLPVLARPDTAVYRTRKFLRRHRAGVLAAGIMLGVLSAGLFATLWQASIARIERSRAERRFEEVRSLAKSVLFELHDGIASLPGSTAVRRQLVAVSVRYLDTLAREVTGNLELQLEVAEAYRRVGDVQGNPYLPNLGDLSGASASYRKALEIVERVPIAHAGAPAVVRGRADALEGLADILVVQSRLPAAVDHHRRALALRETLAAGADADTRARRDLSRSHHRVGDTLLWMGDPAAALEHHRRGFAIRQGVARAGQFDADHHVDLAASLSKLGETLEALGDHEAALRSFTELENVLEPVRRRDPAHAPARRYRAIGLSKSGEILKKLGRPGESVERQRRAVAERLSLVRSDPANRQALRDLAVSRALLSEALAAASDSAHAQAEIKESLAIFESLAADPSNAGGRADLVLAHIDAGRALAAGGDLTDAITSYARAAEIAHALVAADPADATARQNLGEALLQKARLHCTVARRSVPALDRGEHARQALADYAAVLEVLSAMAQRGMQGDSKTNPATVRAELAQCDAPLKAQISTR